MSVFSWDINDLWILQFDWLREFWLITQEPGICQISFLCRYKTSSINFHLSPILEKKIEKTLKTFILAVLGQFRIYSGKIEFAPKTGLCQFLDFTIIYHLSSW